MTRRVEISTAIQRTIEKFLIAHEFSRYRELSNLLRKRYGVCVSKTWLQRHNQTFRREYQAAQRLATRARAMAAAGISEGSPLFNRSIELLAQKLDSASAAEGHSKTKNRHRPERRRRVAA